MPSPSPKRRPVDLTVLEDTWQESPEERRITSGDMEAIQDDALAGRSLHEGTPEDAERLAEGDV